jgi:hypothetical protein
VLHNANVQRSAYFADVTSATLTGNTVHTFLRLLGISNRSSFHQCPTERMFSFENGPNSEAVPNASEVFGNTPKIWDNNLAIICSIWKTVAYPWHHTGMNGFLCVFIKYQIMFCVLNFPAEILPILTNDLGCTERIILSRDGGHQAWNVNNFLYGPVSCTLSWLH